MSDAEYERIGRTWAGERGKRPRLDDDIWLWESAPAFATKEAEEDIPGFIWDMTEHVQSTEAAAYTALGKAIVEIRAAVGTQEEGRVKELTMQLKRCRSFAEYARYELEPGPATPGTQFPTQACADKLIGEIDAALRQTGGG